MQAQGTRKILIILNDEMYTRNYLGTKVFSLLEQEYLCEYAIANDLSEVESLLPGRVVYRYAYSASEKRAHFRLHYHLMWQARRKSKTFRYRYLRWLAVDRIVLFGSEVMRRLTGKRPQLPLLRLLKLPFAVGWSVLVRERAWPLLLPVLGALCPRVITRKLLPPVSRQMEAIFASSKPDLVIMPSNAGNRECLDVTRAARNAGARTLFLIDNWDNLSSKSIFYLKPDHLAVWGRQSQRHAIDIHGFSQDDVSIIGTPRFDVYERDSGDPLFPFPYVLFTGCFLRFNEVECLELLDRELQQHEDLYGGLRIIFRPHPWRERRFNERRALALEHVVVDPQLYTSVVTGKVSYSFQPDLDYYPRLLKHARFVMGPLTSMLIEGALCKKKVLAIAYHDGSFTSPWMAYQNYEHFVGLDAVKGIRICTRKSELCAEFRATFSSAEGASGTADEQLDAIIAHGFADAYPQRLGSLVRQIFAGHPENDASGRRVADAASGGDLIRRAT